jgi:hypothetical protein
MVGEPYPLALRIVNLVKWFARTDNVSQEWIASLARQAQALYVQEERHLLANHLFVDGKALVFAGAFLVVSLVRDGFSAVCASSTRRCRSSFWRMVETSSFLHVSRVPLVGRL